MPPGRRTFLKGLGVAAIAPTLSSCSDGNNNLGNEYEGAIAQRPAPSVNFDFPIVSELPFAQGVASGDPLNGSTPENVAAGFFRSSTPNSALENTRRASVGVEFAPTSMGRGGFDETFANIQLDSVIEQQVSAS